MTTVTGILRDAQQNAIPNAGVTVRYTRALVGFDGGAVAQNDRLFTTDGSGLLTMTDLIPGHYEVSVFMPVNDTTTQAVIRRGAMSVLDDGPMSLEDALDTHVTVTPGALLAAQAAADDAQAQAAIATTQAGISTTQATEAKQARDQAVAIAAEDLPSTVVLTAGNQTIAGVKTFTGQITGTAVTQSATDTTAGRLLKVGDFGLGTTQRDQAASVLDANELPQATGLYVYKNLLTPNAPSAQRATVLSNAWVTGSGNDSRTEFAIEARTGTRDVPPRAFVRDYREGGTPEFSVWGELYSNYNILGTVSESSGVPTGAIIERGSNANGEFVKYADGTLICTSPDFTLDCDIAFENIFRSESTTWTYPSIFSDIPRGAAHTINSVIPIAHTRLMSSSAQLRLSCGGARTGDRCAAVAIGRWF